MRQQQAKLFTAAVTIGTIVLIILAPVATQVTHPGGHRSVWGYMIMLAGLVAVFNLITIPVHVKRRNAIAGLIASLNLCVALYVMWFLVNVPDGLQSARQHEVDAGFHSIPVVGRTAREFTIKTPFV